MDIFDTDKFINEIKKGPALHNKTLTEYSDKQLKEKLWIEIYENMIKNWNELGKDVKTVKGKEIHDNFRKEISTQKTEKSQARLRKRIQSIYFNQLMFLFDDKQTSNDNTSSHREDHQIRKYFESRVDSLDNNVEKKDKSDRRQTVNSAKKKKPNYVEAQPETVQKKQVEEVDEDRLFLLSLLPSFRRMTETEKLNLKIDFLNLIRQVTATPTHSNCLTPTSTDSYEH